MSTDAVMSHRRVWRVFIKLLVILAVATAARYASKKLLFSTVPTSPSSLAVGSRMPLERLRISQTGMPLIILVTSPSCPYCVESRPFHEKLVDVANRTGKAVVTVAPTDAAPEDLSALFNPGSEVRHVDLSSIGISHTPTILIVGTQGLVDGLWRGKLNKPQEDALLMKLSSGGHLLARANSHPRTIQHISDIKTYVSSSGKTIIDPRSREQYKTFHFPSAINIPFEEFALRAPIELDRTKEYVIECSSLGPVRCEFIGSLLFDAGFAKVWFLDENIQGASCASTPVGSIGEH